MPYRNEQTKKLKTSILWRMIISLTAFTLIFVLCFFVFDLFFKPTVSNIIYYGIFRGSYRSIYDFLSSVYIPLVIALFLGGFFLIIRSGVNRSLRYFDTLFASIENIMGNKDEPIVLPEELTLTAHALNQIRETNRHNEQAAKAAEQRKNELVVYLAHDIKTPLTSIIGYLSLLSESPDMPIEVRAKYANIALDKAYRLEGLIEEFFEITRYNLQSIPIEREHFDAVLFCQQVIDDLYPQAQARSLAFTLEAPESLVVFADANRLSRVLNNVMKNALSYAEGSSTITVLVEKCVLRETEDWLKIMVSNQGREISPEHLASIFEKFYRGDQSRSTDSGGSGLGLSIAQEIVRAHGGDITAASADGFTSFAIWIPQM